MFTFKRLNSAIILVLIATLLWGGTPPIMKLTLQEVPTFSLAFIRMSIASIILGTLLYRKLKVKKEDIPQFIKAAITGTSLNLTFFFFGLKLAPAINAALLVGSVPIFTILAAHVFLKEKMSLKLIAASTVAFIGVVVIIGKPETNTSPLLIIGNILLLLSSLAWVFHEIVAKKLLKVYDGGTVAFYTTAIGALTFLPMTIFEFAKDPTWINNVSTKGYAGILYGIIFASCIAYWAWQKGLSKLGAGQASFFFYLDPISGAILSIVLLGEKLTTSLIIGGILIALGVILAEAHRKNHPLHKRIDN